MLGEGNALHLQIASDLHVEFFQDLDEKIIIEPSAPYLALVGDIGIPSKCTYRRLLEREVRVSCFAPLLGFVGCVCVCCTGRTHNRSCLLSVAQSSLPSSSTSLSWQETVWPHFYCYALCSL